MSRAVPRARLNELSSGGPPTGRQRQVPCAMISKRPSAFCSYSRALARALSKPVRRMSGASTLTGFVIGFTTGCGRTGLNCCRCGTQAASAILLFSSDDLRRKTRSCQGRYATPASPTRRQPMKSASSRSAKRPNVKPKSISPKSKTDWARLKADAVNGPTAEHPEADVRHIVRGMVRRGLQDAHQHGPARVSRRFRLNQMYAL